MSLHLQLISPLLILYQEIITSGDYGQNKLNKNLAQLDDFLFTDNGSEEWFASNGWRSKVRNR
jgi:hypothetical protein